MSEQSWRDKFSVYAALISQGQIIPIGWWSNEVKQS